MLNLEVVRTSKYFGDRKAAIDEAYSLSKELNLKCCLNYVDQYTFIISPDMSEEDIEILKNRKIVIGI